MGYDFYARLRIPHQARLYYRLTFTGMAEFRRLMDRAGIVDETPIPKARFHSDADLAFRSRHKGKVPVAKFSTNDRWIVTPEECEIIASKLQALSVRDADVAEFIAFNRACMDLGGYEVD